jgi:hypothetical protein
VSSRWSRGGGTRKDRGWRRGCVLLLGLTGHSLPLIEDQPTMVRRWYVTDWTGLNFHCRPCTFPLCLFCTTRGRKSCDPTRPITTARSPLPAPTGSRCCAVLYCTSSATTKEKCVPSPCCSLPRSNLRIVFEFVVVVVLQFSFSSAAAWWSVFPSTPPPKYNTTDHYSSILP